MDSQAAQIARLRAANAENRARAASMRTALTPGMLLRAPFDRGWTIGQVFEHLVMTHESYYPRLRAAIERGRAAPGGGGEATVHPTTAAASTGESAGSIAAREGIASDFPWRPSLLGGWLSAALAKPGKLPAPGIYRPAPQPRPEVVGAFVERLDDTTALLTASAALEWQRLRLASPVSPLFRMNIGDAFTILAHHDTRHMGQVERVRGQAGFPRPR